MLRKSGKSSTYEVSEKTLKILHILFVGFKSEVYFYFINERNKNKMKIKLPDTPLNRIWCSQNLSGYKSFDWTTKEIKNTIVVTGINEQQALEIAQTMAADGIENVNVDQPKTIKLSDTMKVIDINSSPMTLIQSYITVANFVKFKGALLKRKMKISDAIQQYECKLFTGYSLPEILAVSFVCNDDVKSIFNEYKMYL